MSYQMAPQYGIPMAAPAASSGATMVIGIVVMYFLYRRLIKPWWLQYRFIDAKTWIPDPYGLNSPWWEQFRLYNPATWFITDEQIQKDKA